MMVDYHTHTKLCKHAAGTAEAKRSDRLNIVKKND